MQGYLQIWSKIDSDFSVLRDRLNMTANLVREPFEQAELYFTATPETASQCAAQIILHSASFVLHLLALWASLNLVAIIVYVLCFKKPASVQLLVEDCQCKSCDVHRLR